MFENKISLASKNCLEKYLDSFDYKTSGLSFSSLFMWRKINNFSYAEFNDYLFINGVDNLEDREGENFVFPPLTKTGEYDIEKLKNAILSVKKYYEKRDKEFLMMLIPLHILEYIKKALPFKIKAEADRDNFDYLYLKNDLINLSGKKFHAKKNHLNYFLKNYKYEYKELTTDMTDKIIAFLDKFNSKKTGLSVHEKKLLLMEKDAMIDVIKNIKMEDYFSGGIFINDELAAFTIGGKLGKCTITVHVEKANTDFRGLYQAISNEFCKAMPKDIKYVNREEDMGILGLRKAKLSLNPVKMIEKYIVKIK
jgi:hypothetical protein